MADTPATASAPAAASVKLTGGIDVKDQAAIVAWQDSEGQAASLSNVTIDVHHNVRAKKAFIKLRASVLLQDVSEGSGATSIYVFINPERVDRIALEETPEMPEATTLATHDRPAFGLQFECNKPPALVVPHGELKGQDSGSRETLHLLFGLARQVRFAVYVYASSLLSSQLLSLCKEASRSGRALKSIAAHAELRSLYQGKGGRLLETADLPSARDDSPARSLAAEDPPSQESSSGTKRPEEPVQSEPSRKRRRCSPGSPSEFQQMFQASFQDMFRASFQKTFQDMFQTTLERMMATTFQAAVDTAVDARFAALEAALRARIDGQIREQVEESVDGRVEHLGQDLREEAAECVTGEVDDRIAGLKDELEEGVRAQVDESWDETRGRVVEEVKEEVLGQVLEQVRVRMFEAYRALDAAW